MDYEVVIELTDGNLNSPDYPFKLKIYNTAPQFTQKF